MLARKLVPHCLSTLIRDDEYILQHVWSYKLYASGNVYTFVADQETTRCLAGVKCLTRLGMRHLFSEAYHFCCWSIKPLWSMLPSQASLT
jgi:hypothetical protein